MLGVLLASLMATAPAFAQDGTAGDDGGIPVVDDLLDGITTDTPLEDATTDTPLEDATADGGLIDTVVDAVTDLIPDGGTDSPTTPTGPSGNNTVIQYSPYPVPVFGDYGKRYYGKYWDHGCGCDRYAAPTYVPQVVNATQVSSVPKGGVDTGDGSFQ
ncbi:hypothetical protein [Actinomycetospora soli]|uniref:hypothetical protein n=1 Tax=Actinomycetospora soli TaxID=2893887 RepID=UPI001E3BFDC2|nr:hypothetical protein [Actinomycetospora soli]MCD2187020.1 hypothetical protein [Actinomycetospora soli]